MTDETYANGGDSTTYDTAAQRGKYFSSVHAGTITEICVWARDAGTSVSLGVRPGHDTGGNTFTETISTTAGSNWNCLAVRRPWSSATLFIERTGGNANVGWDQGTPYDSWYFDAGSNTWKSENYRRGYKLTIHFDTLENGGYGTGTSDTAANRGKYFASSLQGVITQICVYAEDSGQSVVLGFKPNHDGSADTFTETVTTAAAGGWTCLSVSHEWRSNTLFLHRTGGGARVDWESTTQNPDSYYLDTNGVWQPENYRRGYRLLFDTTSADENGGVYENGGTFDQAAWRGDYFDQSYTGTITKICAFMQSSGEQVTLNVKPEHDGSAATFQETITASETSGWTCKGVSHAWSSSHLFIYRTDTNAHVSYDSKAKYDSWYSTDNGQNWQSETYRRGYRVVFTEGANNPPTACFSNTVSGLTVNVDGSCSTDPDGDTLAFEWDWGDGTAHGSGRTASHTYGVCPSGSFTVTLTVTDGHGGSSGSSQGVSVNDVDADGDLLVACRETQQGTSDSNSDTDDDGLTDYEESQWYPNRGSVFCGASTCAYPAPRHHDVYVEMDYMGSDHLPASSILGAIVTVFANAPGVSNPDGAGGVKLHLDAGSGSTSAYDLGGGNSIAHQTNLGSATTGDCSDYNWSDFAALKSSNFNSNRVGLFHYVIWAHQLATSCPGTSGVSQGFPAKNFIVSLGGWAGHGDDNAKEGTFIHELGHNLGLQHGGTEQKNNKPNYLSVMNYLYQTGVLKTDGTRFFGYSESALPSLDENQLAEQHGLQSPDAHPYVAYWYCPDGSETFGFPADGALNWNCNSVGGIPFIEPDPLTVAVDLNKDANKNVLIGAKDWSSLNFHGVKGPGAENLELHELSYEEYLTMMPTMARAAQAVGGAP